MEKWRLGFFFFKFYFLFKFLLSLLRLAAIPALHNSLILRNDENVSQGFEDVYTLSLSVICIYWIGGLAVGIYWPSVLFMPLRERRIYRAPMDVYVSTLVCLAPHTNGNKTPGRPFLPNKEIEADRVVSFNLHVSSRTANFYMAGISR
jgi:hypothetical protein